MIRSSVDFPQPLGPITERNCPRGTFSEKSRSAVSALPPVPELMGKRRKRDVMLSDGHRLGVPGPWASVWLRGCVPSAEGWPSTCETPGGAPRATSRQVNVILTGFVRVGNATSVRLSLHPTPPLY